MTYFVFIIEKKLNFSSVPYNVKLYAIIWKYLELIYKGVYKLFIRKSKP